MAPPRQCQVCNEALSKYKCPSCLVPYCSLTCFKKHKEIPCAKPEACEEKSKIPSSMPTTREDKSRRPCYVDEPSEVLRRLQLESLASSSEIRDALRDEDLQNFIHKIDSSPNAENELERAMGVEVFRIFADKILTAVNP